MNLTLIRRYNKSSYCIGDLYVDGIWFSNTIEDVDRHLSNDMPLEEIKAKKVYGETAIPYGTYKIMLTWSMKFKRLMPRLLNVKGFDGILMHVGNTEKDSYGCLIVGLNKIKGKVINSRETFNKLFKILRDTEEEIYITITCDYH